MSYKNWGKSAKQEGYIMRIDENLKKIKSSDKRVMEKSAKHWLNIAKPLYSLGKLEETITKIAGIKRSVFYSIEKKALIVMCADNGVVEEGVTQTGQDITAVVTENFKKGLTSVSIMSEIAGADVFPVDIGIASDVEGISDMKSKVAYGTKNIAKGPAMTREQMIFAVQTGINKVAALKEKGYEIIATGEMGIGNTTTSSAVASVIFDMPPEEVTGRGAGLSDEGLEKKINVIKKAIEINKPRKNNPMDVLMKVGGLDIAGLVGVFIGGAAYSVPIVIDGFISAVSAALAIKIRKSIKDYIIASHVSMEPASGIVLEKLGLSPIITANMNLGEGTGAVALFPLLDMAYGVYSKMHTFQNWNSKEKYKVLKERD